jgi:hypothetical protein
MKESWNGIILLTRASPAIRKLSRQEIRNPKSEARDSKQTCPFLSNLATSGKSGGRTPLQATNVPNRPISLRIGQYSCRKRRSTFCAKHPSGRVRQNVLLPFFRCPTPEASGASATGGRSGQSRQRLGNVTRQQGMETETARGYTTLGQPRCHCGL